MGFSPQTKMNIKSVVIITVSWTLIGIFLTLYNKALLSSPNFSLGPSPIYNFNVQLILWSSISFVGGIIGGTFLVSINSKVFRKKSFRYALITTAYSFTLMFVLLLMIFITIRAKIALGETATFQNMIDLILEMLTSFYGLANYFLWGTVTLLTLFMLQVNDKFGPGILRKFLYGKYFHPKVESRIFMFLDMKSSTTIAEQLGNEKYFRLLRDLFSHLTEPILNTEGEIYQYVGDEIVISWPLKRGLRNANCINCFYQIREKLIDLEEYYNNKYAIKPTFKAGLHHGNVMAGEIGIIKKDIIYSGDILNTTARIQSMCNEYNVDFLVSEDTLSLLKNSNQYEYKTLGEIKLKGKKQLINISSVKQI
ncbi:MAG: adenylate/guanylate cyclase domain-containing protein [Flavobacteriales bacterium]|nr:adenylate/guanylate cyclase domain-containing protein [Flavobacteriales bacterium]